MVDTSHIDLTNIVQNLKSVGSEYHGPCPICGGNDRFVIKKSALNRWFCRNPQGHKQSGDAINLLMIWRNITFQEACAELGIQLERQTTFTYHKPATTPARAGTMNKTSNEYLADDSSWQLGALEFVQSTFSLIENCFPQSQQARDYLEKTRKLNPFVTDSMRLGYSPATTKVNFGSHVVQTYEGIVIPWFYQKRIIRINFRRTQKADGESRYMPATGSGTGLYNADMLYKGCHAVLVEGEFDALSIIAAQPRPLQYIPVATGSVSHARTPQWLAKLAVCERVGIAFDVDSNEAGENAARWWLNALPNSYRLKPLAHDVSDMWQAGMDVYEWLRGAYR